MAEKIKPVVVAVRKRGGPKKGRPAVAVQVAHEDGLLHVVGLDNIRVVIVRDGTAWFAQGLDIDYASQGGDVEETKSNFERGLSATINQHLQVYGNIRKLLIPAAPEICANILLDSSVQFKRYSQISAHEVHEALKPGQIQYLLDQEPQCA